MSSSVSRVTPAVLTADECAQVLERNGRGRLGCYSPSAHECYVVPVAYIYHPGAVYLALAPGQKLSFLTEHPEGVCLEVEEVRDGEDWKTVLAIGDFKRVDQAEHPIGKMERRGLRKVFEIGLAPYRREDLVLCKLDIRKVSGRHDSWSASDEWEQLAGRST